MSSLRCACQRLQCGSVNLPKSCRYFAAAPLVKASPLPQGSCRTLPTCCSTPDFHSRRRYCLSSPQCAQPSCHSLILAYPTPPLTSFQPLPARHHPQESPSFCKPPRPHLPSLQPSCLTLSYFVSLQAWTPVCLTSSLDPRLALAVQATLAALYVLSRPDAFPALTPPGAPRSQL